MSAPNAAVGAGLCADALVRPAQQSKLAPCMHGCASGNDVRQWIGIVAQRAKLGLSKTAAYMGAWRLLTETNPFPASLGRICPHPCQAGCNRADKDGPVAINAMERFLGDWALKHGFKLARLEGAAGGASIGVVGAGPAGLSFAYQLARRAHRVTVYEKRAHAGGMLRFGIPDFRLPKSILQAEIERILALGVRLELNVKVGHDIGLDELRKHHDELFLGIGAGTAMRLGVSGEQGPGVLGGIDFLEAANGGAECRPLDEVVVVGGGNTAIDAARTARRRGARVTLLYRRTREEMPAAADEVAAALAEGVAIEFLAAPAAIRREATLPKAMVAQRMALGEPDASGRRRPVPVPGATFEVPAHMIIAAVSQSSDWSGLDELEPHARAAGNCGALTDGIWAGGDDLAPGIAAAAIAQGRRAAEAAHARVSRAAVEQPARPVATPTRDVAQDFYAACRPVQSVERPAAERMMHAELETHETISEAAFLQEAERCFSCGQCHGCQYCFMYCNVGGFVRRERVEPGAYFALVPEPCVGCGKCIDLCPTGFLSRRALSAAASTPC